MAGFIDAAVQDINSRLQELKEEEQRLLAARTALTGAGAGAGTRRGPGRPPRSGSGSRTASASGSESPSATPRRRRGPGRPRGRRGGNTRASQALKLVQDQPGITIPGIAAAMKIEPNYLYRVMPKLTADGLIRRDGQGWHPAQAEKAPAA